ncbi:MAG: hypothetical protein GX971_12460 [Firmicutes bacterium]|nr:hypothetical protein [Bacillota bacterium]
MTSLYIVPNVYLRQFRRSLVNTNDSAIVVTMPGLVAQILKEGLVSYKEDAILEEVAIWQCVQDHVDRLHFFAPITQFTGFIRELKWLFDQLDHGEAIFVSIPERGQAELQMLHERYHEILAEHGVINAAGQIKRATQFAQENRVLPEVTSIILQGLGELSPVEEEFINSICQGRMLEKVWPRVERPTIEVYKAPDPLGEVEMIGAALREEIERGVPLDRLGVAFPNPSQYLPILIPVFENMRIPWRVPTTSLRNTPLGKTILTLLAGTLGGWHKHHLELLTAPGWGFPFNLSPEEHRLLRLAPTLKGLAVWRSHLGKEPSWERVFDLLSDTEGELVTRPLHDYGTWLQTLLAKLQPELWVLPEQNLENWADLVKAWDGLQKIAESLRCFGWEVSPEQFIRLLESLLDNYQIQGRRIFSERVQIMGVEQLGAYTYHKLYVGGLVEGQFPQHRHAHWLTKATQVPHRDELYGRLIAVAENLHLSYPEVDRSGKLNLPTTVLPECSQEDKQVGVEPVHHPSLFFGSGLLEDENLLQMLQKSVLEDGLSVSQLNRYANCPYQFFCDYVLQLKPMEEESLELDARDHGNIINSVLQRFWQKYLEGQLPAVDGAQLEIEGLLREEYLRVGQQPAPSLIRSMRSFIRKDLLLAEKGFRPRYLEKWFQGVAIPTSQGTVDIRGRIDRIDLHPNGAYVLYDYKTGSAPTLTAMVEGGDVQIAAYLLASQTILPHGHNVGVAYYLVGENTRKGIFHDQYHSLLGVRRGKNVLSAEDFEAQYAKFTETLQELVEGILQGRFPIEPASSRTCSFCPFQGICRKEVGFS